MGNLPIQINNFRLINAWTLEKKLLIWRTIALSACIIGTVVYMRPLEPYIEAPIFGVLVPTFITGYVLIHSSDILLLTMRKDYVFLVRSMVRCNWSSWKSDVRHLPILQVDRVGG
ncbi:uncharacterized protein LOC122534797 [Frieseomelitta varia]|uniref:uncharacterized protein LOC122534797 n=1 Tax=Frieseomelitta varia TaxID=561572 RepID=UPI001CB69113|nr:uncharacterized protein LOC122534797 [Frieseomelitta varia]